MHTDLDSTLGFEAAIYKGGSALIEGFKPNIHAV